MRLKSALLSLGLLALSACGGGGGGSAGGNNAGVGPGPVVSGNMVFVGDTGNYKLAAIDTLTPKPGALSAKIFTSDTTQWLDGAFDGARDELYVAALNKIDVYANASKLDGTIKPARTINPDVSGLIFVQRVFLDKANDRLYIGMKARLNGAVAVFEQASKINGTVTPSRIISGPIFGNSITLDFKRNVLYALPLCCSSPTEIGVMEHIDTARGETPITRKFAVPTYVNNLALDSSRDRLYLVGDGKVHILNSASTAVGSPAVTSLALPTARGIPVLTIDTANDRLYTGSGATAFVLDNASQLNNSSNLVQAVAVMGTPTTNISFFAVPQ